MALRDLEGSAGPVQGMSTQLQPLMGERFDPRVPPAVLAAVKEIPVAGPAIAAVVGALNPLLATSLKSAVCDPSNPYNEITGGGAWPYCAIPGGKPFADSKGWDRATAESMAMEFAAGGGGGAARSPPARMYQAGDPGIRHHLGTLKHLARQLCRVLAAFD